MRFVRIIIVQTVSETNFDDNHSTFNVDEPDTK